MLIDLILALFFITLTVGFYTKNLDWVIIHYGCAPDKVKEKLDGEKIMFISWVMTLITSVFFFLAIFMGAIDAPNVAKLCRILGVLIFIVMYIWTFMITKQKKK